MKPLNHKIEIRIAGFGGQGVVTIGRILGMAFTLFGGVNSVNTQSYGPESRGGACRSELIVKNGEINYPYVRQADLFIALSQLALDTYIGDLKKGGVLVVDAGAVNHVPDGLESRVFRIPMMTLAREAGDVKYQNMVALGAAYAFVSDWVGESSVLKAMAQTVPEKTLDDNRAAFAMGQHCIPDAAGASN